MAEIDIATVLACLVGISVFLTLILVTYWMTQRVYPGFGLWVVGGVAGALTYVFVAFRGSLPSFLPLVIAPGLMVLATNLRLETLRRFLGRTRFDYRTLALPVVTFGVTAYFAYGATRPYVGYAVAAALTALASWATAGAIVYYARRGATGLYPPAGALFVAFGALVLVYGVYWGVRSEGSPLSERGVFDVLFLALLIGFEVLWAIMLLASQARRTSHDLEVSQRIAEKGRRQLSAVIAFLPDATFAVDADRRVVAWNKAAEDLTGVPAEAVVGKPYEETIPAAFGYRDGTLLDYALDPAKPLPGRYRDLQRDGEWVSAESDVQSPGDPGRLVHLWLTAGPLRDPSGAVTGAIESIRDVSERESTARALRESEERFRSLFEVNIDGILVVAPDGTIEDTNPAACAMLGMTKDDIRAAGRQGIIRRNADVEESLESRSGEPLGTYEFTFVRKDGTVFPAECVALDWRDSLGNLHGFVVFRDISERVQAQKVLRESESRLLQAQAVSHVGNWEIDLVAQSAWFSPECYRIHGDPAVSYVPYDKEVFCSRAEDPEVLAAALDSAMAGTPADLEYRVRRSNDSAIRTIHSVVQAEFDEAGDPVKITGVVQDITDLRQVEEALRLMQDSVDHAGDRVYWVDSEGRFVHVSDATCGQLGYTREEMLGMTVYDLDPTVVPHDWERNWEEIKRVGSRTLEGVHRAKDGREISVETSVHYIVHEGKEYHFVYSRDIGERIEIEESLRLTQYSIDHAGDQVFWISPEGKFLQVSDSTCQQLGYKREELLNMSIYDVDPTLSRDWRHTWEAVKHRGSNVNEALLRTKDGAEIPVEIRSDYIEHDGQEYNLVFARDISERKRTEQESIAAGDRLRHSQTMEAIGQLAGGIAHDFNNLLTAIIGYGNLVLASDDLQDASVRTDVEEIRAAAERASSLTRQILAFSRRQPLRPQVLSLTGLVAEMEPRIRELLGEDIEYSGASQTDPCYVDVDGNQFEQVLTSLVSNAKDAMPEGGRLTLEVRDVALDEEYCRAYPESRPGEYVMVSVSDTGIGMTGDTVARVFEPFFTTKAPGAGIGLGLSMVYGIVRQSGGFVNVYSDVGEGTTFKVYLPRVQHAAEAEETWAAPARAVRGDETILVVEDEDPLRRLVARVLTNLGYKVVVAGSGPEALEMLEVLEHPPDLLLTDVILPGGLQGNELAEQIGEKVPGLAILYMSGHTRDAVVHSGRLDEQVDFLGKPFTPESLGAKVREVLSRPPR